MRCLLNGMIALALVGLVTTGLRAQGKASFDAEKARVAVLPFDAVKLTEDFGKKESLTWDKSSVTYEKQAEPLFADVAAVEAFAEATTQKVVGQFVKLKRFTVIERTALDRIIKEQDAQMSDLFDPNKAVNFGAVLGAQYIAQGQLQQVTAHPKSDDKGKFLGYSATVEFQIRIIDVSTGEITATKDVKGSTEAASVFGVSLLDMVESSPSKAAYKALNEAEDNIGKWLKNAFPVEGEIFEVLKTKKKEGATSVSITCGKDLGVKKGDAFKVYIVKEVEVSGKMVRKTTDIGKLAVTKTEEDGVFSTCSVEKGGKDIEDRIAKGEKLKVVSVKK